MENILIDKLTKSVLETATIDEINCLISGAENPRGNAVFSNAVRRKLECISKNPADYADYIKRFMPYTAGCIKNDIKETLQKSMPDEQADALYEEFKDLIFEKVICCEQMKKEGTYNEKDVRHAIGETVCRRLGIFPNAETEKDCVNKQDMDAERMTQPRNGGINYADGI